MFWIAVILVLVLPAVIHIWMMVFQSKVDRETQTNIERAAWMKAKSTYDRALHRAHEKDQTPTETDGAIG